MSTFKQLIFNHFLFICLEDSLRSEMKFESISPSYKSVVSEPENDNDAHCVNGKVWLFGKKYVDQKSYNWGHRVTFAGSYAVAFNTNNNSWETAQQFSALTNEENAEEVLFIMNGAVHLLLYTNFGDFEVKRLFKWSGQKWESRSVEGFNTIRGSERDSRINVIIADGTSDSEKFIVSTFCHIIRVHKILPTGNGITIEHVVDVPADVNKMHGQAISAIHSNNRILIFFGVMGCGFRWERSKLIVCDLENKHCDHVEIMGGNETACPPFTFSNGHGIAPNGDWLFIGGSSQVGISGSAFEGSIWALRNLSGIPEWKQIDGEIPQEISGEIVVDHKNGIIYSIGKDHVGKAII